MVSRAIVVGRENRRRVRPETLKPIPPLKTGDVVAIDGAWRVVKSSEPLR